MKYLVVISNIIFLCVICNAEANWYNTNWQYRDQQNATGAWNSNFKGVWHLKETSGGSGAIKGSTSNGHNDTDTNSQNLGATGQIGNAISFDGTNDYIDVRAQAALRLTTFTHSFWIKSSSTDVRDVIISIYDTSTGPTTAEYGVIDRTNTGDAAQLGLGAGAELPPAQQMWTSLRVGIRSHAKRMRITLKEAEIAKSQLVTDDEVWS